MTSSIALALFRGADFMRGTHAAYAARMELNVIIEALRRAVPADLVDEESAIRFYLRHRWHAEHAPCPHCRAKLDRVGVMVSCAPCRFRATVLFGTSLSDLRRPRMQALLLALRAMIFDKRGISARALAQQIGMPHVTLWRHIHRLRELLPPLRRPRTAAAFVQVCGRATRARREQLDIAVPQLRLLGESIRTWLNGTHHGVTARYLPLYLREAAARARATRPATTPLALAPRLLP